MGACGISRLRELWAGSRLCWEGWRPAKHPRVDMTLEAHCPWRGPGSPAAGRVRLQPVGTVSWACSQPPRAWQRSGIARMASDSVHRERFQGHRWSSEGGAGTDQFTRETGLPRKHLSRLPGSSASGFGRKPFRTVTFSIESPHQ